MVKAKVIKRAFLVLSFLAICSISYANALRNPGFESGEDDWYNWNEGANSGVISSEYSHQGKNSACREISGKGRGGFGQILPVNSGESVKASVWAMNPSSEVLKNGAEGYLRIEFWQVNGDIKTPLEGKHIESVHISKPTPWMRLEVSGIVPEGIQEIRVLGFTNSPNNDSTGKVYFDDFEVKTTSGKI